MSISLFKCDGCKEMIDIFEVGYMGPVDRTDTTCHPVLSWTTLCKKCEGTSDEKCDE